MFLFKFPWNERISNEWWLILFESSIVAVDAISPTFDVLLSVAAISEEVCLVGTGTTRFKTLDAHTVSSIFNHYLMQNLQYFITIQLWQMHVLVSKGEDKIW